MGRIILGILFTLLGAGCSKPASFPPVISFSTAPAPVGAAGQVSSLPKAPAPREDFAFVPGRKKRERWVAQSSLPHASASGERLTEGFFFYRDPGTGAQAGVYANGQG